MNVSLLGYLGLIFFHLHKFHDKHEFISLQENILEVDQVGVDQFSHHLKEVHNAPNTSKDTSNHTKRFPSCPFVVGIVSASDRTIQGHPE